MKRFHLWFLQPQLHHKCHGIDFQSSVSNFAPFPFLFAMNGATIEYNAAPILRSVSTYGFETNVPDDDICRLSYYLKCCVIGCGIQIPLDQSLIRYRNAHNLPIHHQQMIVQAAFQIFSLETLINRAIILDDQHLLLPEASLNTFLEFKTASTHFSINNFTIYAGQKVQIHQVMLCTFKWMRHYYIDPLLRYQQGNVLIISHATLIPHHESLQGHASVSCSQPITVAPIGTVSTSEDAVVVCGCCDQRVAEGSSYGCCQCTSQNDQTHVAEVIAIAQTDDHVPDVPMAIAVPAIDTVALDDSIKTPSSSLQQSCPISHNTRKGVAQHIIKPNDTQTPNIRENRRKSRRMI